MKFDSPARTLGLLSVVAGVAIALGLASYQYSNTISSKILALAGNDIRSNSEIQAHDLSRILENKISAINNNLRVVSNSDVFTDPARLERAKATLSASQEATKDLTDLYFWLDRDGKLVWASSLTPDETESIGVDRSFRPYFTGPRDTGSIYYGSAIVSTDGVPRIHISSPVYGNDGQFAGVVVAAVRLEVLGNYLQSQISSKYSGQVGMMDRNGVILFSGALENVGKEVFGNEFQSKIPDILKEPFNAFIKRSLSGGSGSEDISYQGKTGSLAYETVSVDGKDFAVVYVTAQHTFAADTVALVSQQQNFSTIIILAVGAVAVAVGFLVLTWNRRLRKTVRDRTKELEASNDNLSAALEKLKTHDKLQKEFINIAAHELRTPIQPILSVTEIAQNSKKNGSDVVRLSDEEFTILERNAKRLVRLSSDLLEASRIESNSLKLNKEVFDLNIKIKNVLADSGAFIGGKDVKLVFESTSYGPMMVNADKSRVFEVISNLIRNSAKFTEKGSITVTSRQQGVQAIVSVIDTGKGFDKEIMPRIFEKFATKSDSGTGLGLYIAKSIVEAHGGNMDAENNPDGRGAKVTFSIPCILHEQVQQQPVAHGAS